MTPATSNETDPHVILGVRRNASQKTIRRAYRKLAMENHPDRNVGDSEAAARFKAVHEAYAKLTGKKIEPDNTNAAVYGVLAAVFGIVLSTLIEKGANVKTVDYVAHMRECLKQQIQPVQENVRKMDKWRDALLAMKGRFQGKEAEAMEGIIEHNLAVGERESAKPKKQLDMMQAAMKLLQDCSFKFELQKTMATTTAGMSTSSIRWTIFGM